jgi:hypothetical protein
MKYKDYINLGFERIEMNDNVEFDETGYYGYCLKKVLNDKLSIEVNSSELDKPKLYIKKLLGDTYHIVVLSCETLKDLLLDLKKEWYN